LSRAASAASVGGEDDASICDAPSPTPSVAVCIAVTTYVQKSAGSLSR